MRINQIIGAAALLGTLLPATLPVHAQETVVKIGHTGPLSGALAFAGKDNESGALLAIEELNANPITVGGKKLKFELHSEDDQADPKAGVNVAQKMVDAGIKFVVGPYTSGVAIPASRVYHDAGVLVATVASNPKLTEQGYKGLYRIGASDTQLGSKMALYAAEVLKVKNVAIVDDRTAYGWGVAEEFKKQARASGLNLVGHLYTNDKASDFNAILTNIKSKNADAIFLGGYAPQGAPMARQMRQLQLNARLLGGDTICAAEMARLGGDAVGENVLCAQGGAILDKVASGPAFKESYKKRFKRDPEVYAASFYDGVMMYAAAMKKAGSTDPVKVKAELEKISHKGVAGTYAFDEKGNMKQSPVTVFTFKGGELTPLSSY